MATVARNGNGSEQGLALCSSEGHEALKRDPIAWQSQKFIGHQATYDEPGQPTHLEMRNTLCCGTTLCLPVTLPVWEAA